MNRLLGIKAERREVGKLETKTIKLERKEE